MTAQVIATPGNSSIHSSGSTIVAVPGVQYQIADVAPDGTVGPALTPPDLQLLLNEPNLGDISVTLPDGTVLVFQGLAEIFGQGGGIVGADGTLAVASLEDVIDTAAGGNGGGAAPDSNGSSQAFNQAEIGSANNFGAGNGGTFNAGGVDLTVLGEADPNLILTILAGGGLPLPGLSVGPAVGLEDALAAEGIFLNILVTPPPVAGVTTVIQINGIPEGATLFNDLGPIVTNAGPGPLSVNGLSIAQLAGIGITPPADSDMDFDIVVIVRAFLGPLEATVSETETVTVKAVADAPEILIEGDAGEPKNPAQEEREGRGDSGENDTLGDAQALGTTDGTNELALSVDGWVSTNDPNDVDVYSFTVSQDGNFVFDIDFGDLNAPGNDGQGRIDDADLFLSVFDAAGNLLFTDDNSGFGEDPLISGGAFLTAGDYFVTVTTAGNTPVGPTFADGFTGGGNPDDDGDYRLQIRTDGNDLTTGAMPTVMVLEDNAQDVGGMFVDGATPAARTQSIDIDASVTDTDGSESLTQVKIDIDTLPPGLMIDLNGDGTFLSDGANVVTLTVTRILVDGDPAVADTVDVQVSYDESEGLITFDLDPALRIQSLNLNEFSWKVAQGDDTDFNIEVLVRATETNPSEGTGTLDESQVAVPHAVTTTTIMVNTKAVADKPMLGSIVMVEFEDGPGGTVADHTENGITIEAVAPTADFNVVDDGEQPGGTDGDRELNFEGDQALRITADGGVGDQPFSFLSFDLEFEQIEGGETLVITGSLNGVQVAELVLDGNAIASGDTIVLPAEFMSVDEVQIANNGGNGNQDDITLDNLKFKLPLAENVFYEDQAQEIDGGFENGTEGWMTIGEANRVGAGFGAAVPEGSSQLLLTTGGQAGSPVSETSLESFLGVPAETLEGLIEGAIPGQGNQTVVEGSAAKVTLKLSAGDTVTFEWNFLTDEDTPDAQDDFGFVVVVPDDGQNAVLGSTDISAFALSGTSFNEETGVQTFSFTATSDGVFTFGIGIAEENSNNGVQSGLLVDNLQVNGVPVMDGMLTDSGMHFGLEFAWSVTDTDGSESLTEFTVGFDSDDPMQPFAGGGALSVDGETALMAGDTVEIAMATFPDGSMGPVTATVASVSAPDGDGNVVVTFTLDPADRVQNIQVDGEIGVLLADGQRHKDFQFDLDLTATASETNPTEGPATEAVVFSQDGDLVVADLSTVTSTITVAGVAGAITDLNLFTDITHGWSADLDIFLISPAGTRVEITTDNGGSGANRFAGTVFDDEAADPVTGISNANGAVPLVSPEELLAAFDGEDPNGVWTLEVTDDDLFVSGNLDRWELRIQTDETKEQVAVESQTQSGTLPVTIQAVADKPAITVADDTALEDANGGVFEAPVRAQVTDTDGSESLTQVTITPDLGNVGIADADLDLFIDGNAIGTLDALTVSTVMVRASVLNPDGTDGGSVLVEAGISVAGGVVTLTFDPADRVQSIDLTNAGTELAFGLPEHEHGMVEITVAATATETDPMGEVMPGAETATNTQAFTVSVEAVADTPSLDVSNAHVCVTQTAGVQKITFDLESMLFDTDGSEELVVTLTGLPAGVALSAASTATWSATGNPGEFTATFAAGDTLEDPMFDLPAGFTSERTATLDFGSAQVSNGASGGQTYEEDGFVFTELTSAGFDIGPDNGGGDSESELEMHGSGDDDRFSLMKSDGLPFDFVSFDLESNELEIGEALTITGFDENGDPVAGAVFTIGSATAAGNLVLPMAFEGVSKVEFELSASNFQHDEVVIDNLVVRSTTDQITVTATARETGPDAEVSVREATVTDTVELKVEAVPVAPPVANDDTVLSNETGPLTLLKEALLANDSGTGLFIKEIVSDTVSGTPTIDGNGNIVFDAPSNRSTQTITYRVEDANGLTDTATITIQTDQDGDLNGNIFGSGDLGNGGNEIFGMDEGSVDFEGGNGNDIFMVLDDRSISISGGSGTDTLLASPEGAGSQFDFVIEHNTFSQANQSVEVIDGTTTTSSTVKIRSSNSSNRQDWDFSDIELIGIDRIETGGNRDTVIGSDGDDSIFGGSSDDRLNGGAGNDFIDVGSGNRDTVIIEDRADGVDTIQNFDNSGGIHDVLDLDALFDDLENDLGVTLNAAAREARVVLTDNGPGTDIGIDQSAAGDGSDVVQIAVVNNVSTSSWDVGDGAGDDIFIGA